jgi:hypothetical protein
VKVAAVVDSRNVFHQAGDVCGVRARPSVPGVKSALARYGLDVAAVHVGLALPRQRDAVDLARAGAENEAYRTQVLADGGDPLLGELHRKSDGTIQEKMVDVACAVRVTRYIEEIRHGSVAVEGIVVLSQDSDLSPALDHAQAMGVPIIAAGADVVQHRPYPYLLLGPHAYAEMCPSLGLVTGHEIRKAVAQTLEAGTKLTWEVLAGSGRRLRHPATGMMGIAASGVSLPAAGGTIELWPVGVTWDRHILGAFPMLALDSRAAVTPTWYVTTVLRRVAPLTIRVKAVTSRSSFPYPQGGVGLGDSVLFCASTDRAVGPVSGLARGFSPDVPSVARVVAVLPKGGVLAVGPDGRRGLVNTQQQLQVGQAIPVTQIDENVHGLVWAAIGTPLR